MHRRRFPACAGIKRNPYKLAKIRAETRLKNGAANQIGQFMLMIERLTDIFQETLPPDVHAALQARLAKEFEALPNVQA